MYKIKMQIIVVLIATAPMILFQNCAKRNLEFEDQVVVQTYEEFNYHYKVAPEIYYDYQVAKEWPVDVNNTPSNTLDDDSSIKKYIFTGITTRSNGSEGRIYYNLRLFNDKNQLVCPQVDDYLNPGETLVVESCVTYPNVKLYKVEYRIKPAGSTEWILQTKNYPGI